MAARASWKGYLKLSLVSCAVQLYPASTAKERVSFHMLNRETGHRLKRLLVDSETGEPVESEDQIKGYEIGKRQYIQIEDEEIESVAIESTHTIDIESFVPREEIDETYLDSPYYLAPDGKVAEEAFAVIRDAMRAKNVVGLGRVVLYRRERIVMLEPRDKGLVAITLRYPYEVRADDEVFGHIPDVKIDADTLDLATHIIERKLTHFDPARFEDRYQNALLDIIKAKAANKPAPKLEAPKPSNVVNLMDALRKSIAAETGENDNAAKPPTKAAPKPKPAPAPKAAAKTAAAERQPKAGRPTAARGTSGRMSKAS
jgi:DNA end-binding protein Ku